MSTEQEYIMDNRPIHKCECPYCGQKHEVRIKRASSFSTIVHCPCGRKYVAEINVEISSKCLKVEGQK